MSWMDFRYRVIRKLQKYKILREAIHTGDEVIATQTDLERLLKKALMEYHPHPYPGRVTVFSAKWISPSQFFSAPMDPMRGWGKLAQSGVDVYCFKGDHDSIIRPPHLASLAAHLKYLFHRLDDEECSSGFSAPTDRGLPTK